jgi:hypothetical protein
VPGAAQTVVGTVRAGEPGAPVPGAEVRLLGPGQVVLTSVRTGADGQFRVDAAGAEAAWLLVEAPGYAASLSDSLALTGGGFVDASVRLVRLGAPVEAVAVVEAPDLARACAPNADLTREGIVVGQVREPGGQTLRGAWVTAEWDAGGRVARREGRSGVDGLFVFCDLPAGPTIRLRAAHTDRVGPASAVSVHAQSIHRIDLALPQAVSDRPGRLLGRVLDLGSGEGVAAAELTIPEVGLRLWTDTHGHFAVDSLPPGVHTLRVTGLGYASRESAVVVAPDGAHGVQVQLSREPIELGPLVVTVRSPRWFGDMRGFQRRMRLAAGFFMTRQDISRLQPTRLVDLLREAPGVTVTEQLGRAPTIRMRGRVCDPDLVVDRVPTRDRSLLTELRGADLEAIEVYRSVAENPGEWARPGACGAIVVWTRRAVA